MRTESLDFAALILREGQGHFRFRHEPLQKAAFVVLKSLDLPSVLLEAGYISSPEDVRELHSRAWRDEFGKAVARAIEIFLARENAAAGV